jgi:ABC-type antimicrobial peptide transport system permease subunit
LVQYVNNKELLVTSIAGAMCVLCLVSALIYIVLDMRAETATDYEDGEESPEHVHIGMVFKLPASYWLITGICVTFYAAVFSFMSFGPYVMPAGVMVNL